MPVSRRRSRAGRRRATSCARGSRRRATTARAALSCRPSRTASSAALFDAACGLANDLGLFAEEHDGHQMLGNFPQGLSHYSHIAAAVALREGHPPKAQR